MELLRGGQAGPEHSLGYVYENTVVPSRSQAKNSCEEKDTGGRKGRRVARKSVGREMKGHMVDLYLAGVFSSFFTMEGFTALYV